MGAFERLWLILLRSELNINRLIKGELELFYFYQ